VPRPTLALVLAGLLTLTACIKRTPDLEHAIPSPSGAVTARLAGYQAKGSGEAVLTLTFFAKLASVSPQIRFGRVKALNAGWLDDHTFAIAYELLEPRKITSPIYPSGERDSGVDIVLCDASRLDCGPLTRKFAAERSVSLARFPD
jgi:hypothetical protein